MPQPVIHFGSLKHKDRTACGLKWTPEDRHTIKSDPDRVTCPKCIAAFAKEGVRDVTEENPYPGP